MEMPWIADPLLVNRQALMIGHGCLAGRGLRASARTLCRLFPAALASSFLVLSVRSQGLAMLSVGYLLVTREPSR